MPTNYEIEKKRKATITHLMNKIAEVQDDLDWGFVEGMSEKRRHSLTARVEKLTARLARLEHAEYLRYVKQMERMQKAYERESKRLAKSMDAADRSYKTDEF